MVEADPPMRAARNAFFVLIIALLAVSIYEFAFVEDSGLAVPALRTLGAGLYYASLYYYRRGDD
jgi:hypothetical protein